MVHYHSSMVHGDGRWKGPYPAVEGLLDTFCRTQFLLVTRLTFQLSLFQRHLLTLMSVLTDKSSWSLESCVTGTGASCADFE